MNPTSNPYAERLNEKFGFFGLGEPFEHEFREWYFDQTFTRTQISVFCAVLLFSLFAYKDYFLLSPELWATTSAIRLLIIVPALSFIYAAVYRRGRKVMNAGIVIGSAIGLYSLTVSHLLTTHVPEATPYESLILVSLFIYFMLGLRTIYAVLITAPLLVIFPLGSLYQEVPSQVTLLHSFYLLVTNILGFVGGFTIELLARRNFLLSSALAFDANHDALTGLLSRRSIFQRQDELLKQATRNAENLVLYLLDIDYFKQYNDTYGHQAGDECLKTVGAVVKDVLKRPLDSVGRYGGEEFLLLAYSVTEEAQAIEVAEKVRNALVESNIPHKSSPFGHITASIGCVISSPGATASGLIKLADEALYRAKEAGRNRVELAARAETSPYLD